MLHQRTQLLEIQLQRTAQAQAQAQPPGALPLLQQHQLQIQQVCLPRSCHPKFELALFYTLSFLPRGLDIGT